MEWILGAGSDIVVDNEQLNARKRFIETVTGANVSPWQKVLLRQKSSKGFFRCSSDDTENGVFITAHIDDVVQLAALRKIWSSKFVVADSCVWEIGTNKKLLYNMMRNNRQVELFFSKQELSLDQNQFMRRSVTINNIGEFGFQTSRSERDLFKYRNVGLYKAIQKSFDRVSPILLPGDLYV